jgi:hypothetical protein
MATTTPSNHGFAVHDEVLRAVLQCGLDVPGEAEVQSWPLRVNRRIGLVLAFDAQAIPLPESALCPKIFDRHRHELVACQ